MALSRRKVTFLLCCACAFLIFLQPFPAPASSPENACKQLRGCPVGERIACWAEFFIGTPYDRDPLGEYVTKKAIVADQRVDCMYLVFRSVELALGNSEDAAVEVALDKRFHSRGVLRDGIVANYGERFQYGEDMIDSGKWGREVTSSLGYCASVSDERRGRRVPYVPAQELLKNRTKLATGDVVFLVKKPERRVVGEVIGHMGVIKLENGKVYLIHAAGTKKAGGQVRKVELGNYFRTMPYIGAKVTRFE